MIFLWNNWHATLVSVFHGGQGVTSTSPFCSFVDTLKRKKTSRPGDHGGPRVLNVWVYRVHFSLFLYLLVTSLTTLFHPFFSRGCDQCTSSFKWTSGPLRKMSGLSIRLAIAVLTFLLYGFRSNPRALLEISTCSSLVSAQCEISIEYHVLFPAYRRFGELPNRLHENRGAKNLSAMPLERDALLELLSWQ